MAGFTLYPDKAYLEIKVKLYNRTNFPRPFFGGPILPSRLMMSTSRFSRPMSMQYLIMVNGMFPNFPLQKAPIIKWIIPRAPTFPGTKIFRYPLPIWPFVSKYDFVGGYENDSKGGLFHVADHHVSPGKKQWTWGNGDFGRAWDRNLTDEDGPYIELMCGVYTDNQPDFSWLCPVKKNLQPVFHALPRPGRGEKCHQRGDGKSGRKRKVR